MKKYLNRIALGAGTVGIIIAGAAAFSAFEAHVINVTAKIENALNVPIDKLDFGTVFPQEMLDREFNVSLSQSFEETAQGGGSNLVLNGSFEVPEVGTTQKWDIFPSGTSGLAWTVEWESSQTTYGPLTRPDPALVEYHEGVKPGWTTPWGDQYAELDTDWDGPGGSVNGEPALVRIYQNISTEVGKKYNLHYAYSPRPDVSSAADNELKVRINGPQVASHSRGGNGSTTDWTGHDYEFTATTPTTKIEFAAGGTANSLGVFLDNVSLVQLGRVSSVNYVIRQKPKCLAPDGSHPQVTEGQSGNFVCPGDSVPMPLLCPYLSKDEVTTDGVNDNNDGPALKAFHGLPGVWNLAKSIAYQVYGRLSFPEQDLSDTWNIDLKVPAFGGEAAQDWATFVTTANPGVQNPNDYLANPADESELFGCDLWLEVTGINQPPPQY